ncbi:MAG: alpha/beta hydrolase-fold protein [Chloroflexota bacterium]|nr:alpha/beta hydrolase-fold protein [Chloroflexota bacterium]
MNIGQMQTRSRALGRHITFSFSLPDPQEAGPPPYPALLQLHGATDDHSAWITRSKLAVYLDNKPLIAIMPDGGLSLWGNRGPRERYEDFLMEDLLPTCSALCPVRPGPWAIGGLSMGGFGALRLGLKYPHRFASIWAHSSFIPDRPALRERFPDMTAEELDHFDIYAIAAEAVKAPTRPRLSLDCGTEDFLIEHNRAFHDHLQKLNYPHEYAEHPGAHTWEYWDEHVQQAIPQHLEVLGVTAQASDELSA